LCAEGGTSGHSSRQPTKDEFQVLLSGDVRGAKLRVATSEAWGGTIGASKNPCLGSFYRAHKEGENGSNKGLLPDGCSSKELVLARRVVGGLRGRSYFEG